MTPPKGSRLLYTPGIAKGRQTYGFCMICPGRGRNALKRALGRPLSRNEIWNPRRLDTAKMGRASYTLPKPRLP